MTTFGPLKRFSAVAVTMRLFDDASARFIQPRNRYPLEGGLCRLRLLLLVGCGFFYPASGRFQAHS